MKENGFVLHQVHIFCDLGQIIFNLIHFPWVQFPRRSCTRMLWLDLLALSVDDERTVSFREQE